MENLGVPLFVDFIPLFTPHVYTLIINMSMIYLKAKRTVNIKDIKLFDSVG